MYSSTLSKSTIEIPLQKRFPTKINSIEDITQQKTRRTLLKGLTTLGLYSIINTTQQHSIQVLAEEETTTLDTFYGKASPPASYGGYGGNATEIPKYSFLYPQGWKQITINKVQKGTQGIDSKFIDPKNKNNLVFVIALAREGENSQSFKLTDIESTFQGFVVADYQLQDAVMSASDIKRTERNVGDQKFFDYVIKAPNVIYLSSITVDNGKVFAMFVKTSPRSFEEKEKMYRDMIDSFKTL